MENNRRGRTKEDMSKKKRRQEITGRIRERK